jgi:hypothetical protein
LEAVELGVDAASHFADLHVEEPRKILSRRTRVKRWVVAGNGGLTLQVLPFSYFSWPIGSMVLVD